MEQGAKIALHTYAFHIHFYQWEIKTHCQQSILKHLKVTFRQGKLGNSGHGRTLVLLVHQWFCGGLMSLQFNRTFDNL